MYRPIIILVYIYITILKIFKVVHHSQVRGSLDAEFSSSLHIFQRFVLVYII